MILTTVDRFKSLGDVMKLKKKQLIFFYSGATELNKHDRESFAGLTNGKT